MALRTRTIGALAGAPSRHDQAIGSLGLDWLMIAAASWWIAGVYIDGWAHQHGRVDQSFFTPWHAVLYSGFALGALLIVGTLVRNRQRGYAWTRALPSGYTPSLLGVLLFGMGGQADLIWHTLFGIESGVDALISPSHLLLATGALLFMAGPLRSAWARAGTPRGWRAWLPPLISLAYILSVITFITAYAHPLINLWPGSEQQPATKQDAVIQPYLMNSDGSEQTRLRLPWPATFDLALAPDGGRIAFVAGTHNDWQIHTANLDGSDARALTALPDSAYEPSWSPDGQQIVFTSGPDDQLQLFIMNADGSGQRQLTADPAGAHEPSWSPDGQRIAFTSNRAGNHDLFVINPDGSGETQLTSSPADDDEAVWSTDGARIAFTSDRDLMRRIFVMNNDGSAQARLVPDEISGWDAAWSPDGSQIAFVADAEGNDDIFVASIDGSELRNLTENPSLEEGTQSLAWSRERLLFSTQGREFPGGGTFLPEALGVTSIIFQAALLIGLVLLALRRWLLPPGALTLLVTSNAALMSVIEDRYVLIPALFLGGVLADLLLWRLRPTMSRPLALRVFATATPMLIYTFYFTAIALTEGVWWSIHLSTGAVVLAGVAGLLLSYLVLPPAVPAQSSATS